MKHKAKKSKCIHETRAWCVNCDTWFSQSLCNHLGHQTPLNRCVSCLIIFKEEKVEKAVECKKWWEFWK
jgi:hypothetical protein